MLDNAPPVQIKSVLVEIELLVHLDSRHSGESREIGGHGVGEVDNLPAADQGSGLRGARRNGRAPSRGNDSFEESATRERKPYCFLASWNAHYGHSDVR